MNPQIDNGITNELNKMNLDNERTTDDCESTKELTSHGSNVCTIIKGAHCIVRSFEEFNPLINTFLSLGNEIITLYEKAEHNKKLCSILLKRVNCAYAAVKDLNIRKTENTQFFFKNENLKIFEDFIKCIREIKNFIEDISHLNKLRRFFYTGGINDTFQKLTKEFDGYMNSLNFSFIVESRDEFATMKDDVNQIKDILICVYGVSDDRQSQQNFLTGMDRVVGKNKNFQKQQDKNLNPSEFKDLEENEPLLDGSQYKRTNICPSKKIEKRTLIKDSTDVSFKEFSIKTSPSETNNEQTQGKTQIEIRRQINILKELKNSDHIIRFFGVAQENSKFYLVTEWMDHGNLYEYYTKFGENMNWETKIRFALDICRGVAYLHECEILHHDIQSTNILVSQYHKVRIANFGLSKKFSDATRSISHNLENIRYMAPEKLLYDKNNKDNKTKKVDYDTRCEIYSVGALLWEIAELKKPHSDLDKSEILNKVRKRMRENYYEPLSKDVPFEWKNMVSTAMEYERDWRIKISLICRKLYKLKEKYSGTSRPHSGSISSENEVPTPSEDYKENLSAINNQIATTVSSSITINILATVDDAIREHKSNNGNKLVAWNSFKYHSITNVEARYWVGYYYFYHGDDIHELQPISEKERIKYAIEIFKETADKGNSSAQLRYGMHLWKKENNYIEGFKYLEMSANSKDATAMFIVGKAYWNGINGIKQDKTLGAEYLKKAAFAAHPKAKELCNEYRIL
ncbi:7887_t:CDS:2 [Funneliformis geosporum]|uniref:1881_t:CDS:1 n=1 Tax=Funneliformis geosporum TaxID=1117311 RepID=A0A9W4SK05_9GLOM|nr:7887_t:CDS:2 [Funneliformis geosporum]CAI2169761.1 1881_t:CDS:2 [Funneliformis geosporum]